MRWAKYLILVNRGRSQKYNLVYRNLKGLLRVDLKALPLHIKIATSENYYYLEIDYKDIGNQP